MRKLVYIAGAVAMLLALLVAAVLVVPGFIDWNTYKPRLTEAVKKATGRTLYIDGELEVGLSIALELTVSARALRIPESFGDGEAAPSGAPDLASAEAVEITFPLLPLFARTLEIQSLSVYRPSARFKLGLGGVKNWAVQGGDSEVRGSVDESGFAFRRVRVGDVHVEQGRFEFTDETTGQELVAKGIDITFTRPDFESPLRVDAKMRLNEKPVSFVLDVTTPESLIEGTGAKAAFKLDSEWLVADYAGSILTDPVPGLDGVFVLTVPSAGALAAWLGRPLGHADPGPLDIQARFAAADQQVSIVGATLRGKALDAKVSGSLDLRSSPPQARLDVAAGYMDWDRYFPPRGNAAPLFSWPGGVSAGNFVSRLSGIALPLEQLRAVEGLVEVRTSGMRAFGYEVGKFAFSATLRAGQLEAKVSEFALYGGNISGALQVDASSATEGASVRAELRMKGVRVDAMAPLNEDGEPSVVGVLAADVKLQSHGESPRQFVKNVRGKISADLGGISVSRAPKRALSELNLELTLKGLSEDTQIAGSLVYNREKVRFHSTLDRVEELASGRQIGVDLAVASRPLTLEYKGSLGYRPALGANGRLKVRVRSVGRLARWLGRPLEAGARDPGRLNISAEVELAGKSLSITEGKVRGRALAANIHGELDASPRTPRFDFKLEEVELDIDRLRPRATPRPDASPGWRTAPLDTTLLSALSGQLVAGLRRVRYRGVEFEGGRLSLTVRDRTLSVRIADLGLSSGQLSCAFRWVANGGIPELNYSLSARNVPLGPLLTTVGGQGHLSGTARLSAEGKARGFSLAAMAFSLSGSGSFQIAPGVIHGVNIDSALRGGARRLLLGPPSSPARTEFSDLSGTFSVENGVVSNRDLKLRAKSWRASGYGTLNVPRRTLDYRVEAKLRLTDPERTAEEPLTGIPIPIEAEGPWSGPRFTVRWQGVLRQVAEEPGRAMHLPRDLSAFGRAMGLNIPAADGPLPSGALTPKGRGGPGLTYPGHSQGGGAAVPPDPQGQSSKVMRRPEGTQKPASKSTPTSQGR